MITPLLMGAGVKILTNIVNGWIHNSAEKDRTNALRDAETSKAHIELAKAVNADKIGKISRSIIFLMIIGTWCYIALYGLHNPDVSYDIVLPKGSNWTFGSVFSSSQWEIRKISGSVLMWQWFTLTEMILGFFVVPSRRR
jgi:hypothetical protein